MPRIGLIGGLSWESTASYYRMLNVATAASRGAWQQPPVLIDSLNFADVVAMQRSGEWAALGEMMAESARRLAAGGADVLAIGANTMHKCFDVVQCAVSVPVIDVRDALAKEVANLGASSVSLLGTRYVMEEDFYSTQLERRGLRVVRPVGAQVDELQRIIYDELTQGVVTEASVSSFTSIADDCRSRGGEVVGLCCTEFGLLFEDAPAPWPYVDSTAAHVNALLSP